MSEQVGNVTAPAASRAASPRRRLGRGTVLVASLLLLALIGGGLAWWRLGTAASPQYVTVPAGRGPVTRMVTATGTVNPVLTILVGTYVSGVIQELYCDYNTEVKQGQRCAKIDPRPYQTVVDQDKANLSNAKAQLVKDQANLAYTKLAYDRDIGLLKRGIISQDTLDSALNAYDQARAQIELDQAAIEQRAAELESSEVNLGYTDIISPVDGTVVSRNVTMGQTVAASFQTPTLFVIATDLTQMEVDTNVSESDIGGVSEGQRSTFTVEAFPDRPFEGKVVQVRQAPQTVQNVVTFDVVVGVGNDEHLLKPGMTATTRIVTAERSNVLRVPDQALRYIPGGIAAAGASDAERGTHVWVLRDGKPRRVAVALGLDDDSYTEITGGDLVAGDQVIIAERSAGASSGGTAVPAPRL